MSDPASAQTAVPTWRAWLMAARPKTLPAAVAPVVVGASLAAAGETLVWPAALAALLGALLLQIGSNFANDYFDYVKGVDTAERLGPTRVTAEGLLTPRQIRWGIVVVFGLVVLVGAYLVQIAGWPILVVGVAAMLVALAYAGGPLPAGSLGLGDLFVFLFFGPVAVCGTYYVQAQTITQTAVLASLPMGALITNILVVNNLRDLETDRRAGKQTLAVRWGRRGAQREYLFLLGFAYAMPLVLLGLGHNPFVLAPFILLPRVMRLVRVINAAAEPGQATDGPALNAALAGSARLSLQFALALSIGLLL